ncbi:hypothetical protein CW304_15020 [Bacillus sp. UFRGS-B20]|nr:hypothetical protein CW304_15020 [Bacillus sp. UFRGS-B20]
MLLPQVFSPCNFAVHQSVHSGFPNNIQIEGNLRPTFRINSYVLKRTFVSQKYDFSIVDYLVYRCSNTISFHPKATCVDNVHLLYLHKPTLILIGAPFVRSFFRE